MEKEIQEILQEARDIKAEMQKKLSETVKKVFTKFWQKNPGIKAIVWTQYAPYFDDGNPCVFSVHEPTFTNADGKFLQDNLKEISWGELDYHLDDGDIPDGIFAVQEWKISTPNWKTGQKYEFPKGVKVNIDDIKSISKFITSSVLKETMELTFGSDALVLATKSGFDVREYDHD